jgi:hypothetical protein
MASTQLRTPQIRNSTITTVKIADAAIVASKIATDAVVTLKIKDSNVTMNKIADAAIINQKIGTSAVTTNKMADSNVVTRKIANSNITANKIADAAIITQKIATSNVTTGTLADSNVTTHKLADSSVITRKIATSGVTVNKLADAAVINQKIGTSAVTTNKIADSTVSTHKLADSSVVTRKLANGAVNSAKIASTTITLESLIVNNSARFNGETTFISTTNLTVKDPMILVGSGATTSALTQKSGLEVDRGGAGSPPNASIYFNETDDAWYVNDGTADFKIMTSSNLGNFVTGESFSLGIGSTAVSFQTLFTPVSLSEAVYFNGQRLWRSGNDYTLTNSTITLVSPLKVIGGEDVVLVDYRYTL